MTQVTPLNGRGKGCIRFPNSVSFACSVCAAQSQKLRVVFFYFPDDLIFFSKDQFVHANIVDIFLRKRQRTLRGRNVVYACGNL